MSTIAGKNDLPDFSNVQPLVRKEDLAALEQALAGFESSLAAFRSAAQQAESAVQVTLAWVGVGEKLVNIIGAIVQKRLADDAAAAQEPNRLTELQQKLTQLALLQSRLTQLLPMLNG